MQKYKSCNAKFSWASIYKSFWLGYRPIVCSQCRVEHQITLWGRLIFVFLTIVPMLLFGNFFSPFNDVFVTIAILLFGSFFTISSRIQINSSSVILQLKNMQCEFFGQSRKKNCIIILA
ncbi:TIGR04104 family putative zinc finger protein [Robertmurraya kyonggiensis]|uniref:Uncharacterized protein n=1 Tax=Robertmurraya kyonggiensis TaxID=1037680 RepID=A0A4U1CZX2_9BACI|nr:hypothetical protein FA727_18480 [Robertmurraya kyonggiensis]